MTVDVILNAPRKRREASHVVVQAPGGFECLRCGDSYQMTMPCPIDVWAAAAKAYYRSHRRCPKPKKVRP